ncbi:glycosyltransferase involved in cell wall biosynthesis [Algoriphagus boseongensis]|uniref:Glycosyltransferase involved in cell wall biosynthesis n=1 Tax=Algoriphagus boseongensis TaxID=1442587 RepID=A0A4V3D2N2_9BACT|nr:glycosyltransferase family 4 protein [Algoriphagus boseongensis]TDQ19627.1 glycosyltransferase involved in cell wall biosynthesis [Algoriphagus boseongensis]
MNKKINVLVSNIGLPSKGIGSWTYEIDYFLRSNSVIDIVLSPSQSPSSRFIFCQKRAWTRLALVNKNYFLTHQVAKDYIAKLLEIGKKGLPLNILVVDDQVLLAAISSAKHQLPKGSKLIFYYHGHSLSLSSQTQEKTDEILFLTKLGYEESIRINERFTPEVKIVGNGIDSKLFYPLSKEEKQFKRKQKGLGKQDILVTWMANSRVVKGLHLFQKMIPSILELSPNIKILIIGNKQPIQESERIVQTGSLPLDQVAEYLQLSDFYFFTSLWKEGFGLSLGEAIKCGNYVLASKNGGIPEVLGNYPKARLIDHPNLISEWIDTFSEVLRDFENNLETNYGDFDFENFHSLKAWESRLIHVFES